MNFSDFTPEELIGKTVLYYDGCGRSRITTINRVTKTCFGISHNELLFKLHSGFERGGDGLHQAHCTLITEERANDLRRQWAIDKRVKLAKEFIEHQITKGNPTVEQLEAAVKALG